MLSVVSDKTIGEKGTYYCWR